MWRKQARLAPVDAPASMLGTSPVHVGSVKRPWLVRHPSMVGPSNVRKGVTYTIAFLRNAWRLSPPLRAVRAAHANAASWRSQL